MKTYKQNGWDVPDGFRLVPVETTQEMISEAGEAHIPFGDMETALCLAFAVAPQPPAKPEVSSGIGWQAKYLELEACMHMVVGESAPVGAVPDAQDIRDAARYRWLRDEHIGNDPESINMDVAKQSGLDAAIDAAMQQGSAA